MSLRRGRRPDRARRARRRAAGAARRAAESPRKRNLGVFDPDRGAESIAACYEGLRNGGYYGPFVDVGDYYSPVPPPTPAQKAAQEKFNATIQRQNRPAEKAAIVAAVRAVVTDADGAFWKKIDQCL